MNYDIGNSASLGFDPVAELDSYGASSDIHIKDRVCGGCSVVLGEGDANFDCFFGRLMEFDCSGPSIMRAYRDDVSLWWHQLNVQGVRGTIYLRILKSQ